MDFAIRSEIRVAWENLVLDNHVANICKDLPLSAVWLRPVQSPRREWALVKRDQLGELTLDGAQSLAVLEGYYFIGFALSHASNCAISFCWAAMIFLAMATTAGLLPVSTSVCAMSSAA
jgi:hypothetical protein